MPTFDLYPSRPRQAPDSYYGAPRPSRGRYQRVPWTLGQTILGTLITLAPLLALDVVSQLGSTSAPTKPLTRAQDMKTAIAAFIVGVVLEGALLIAPMLVAVIRRAPGYSALDGLRALGFRTVGLGPLVGWLVAGLAIAVGANAVYTQYVEPLLAKWLHIHVQTNGNLLANQVKDMPLTVLATLVVAAFVAPICEEIFFRGFVQGGFQRAFGAIIAVFLSALIFGIAHGDIGSFAVLFVLGLVLGMARASSGSLWPSWLIHTANNTLAGLVLLPSILQQLKH
jgi:membrane protease YdiL (CAAX protease family)